MPWYNRKSIHVPNRVGEGIYLVTICTNDRICLFGDVTDGVMRLNDAGQIVHACWAAIPDHFPHVGLDAFVVMPNHLHGIVVVAERVRATPASPLSDGRAGPRPGSLGAIVGSFKSATAKRINRIQHTPRALVWQRNYDERAVQDIASVRRYILENPSNWRCDR